MTKFGEESMTVSVTASSSFIVRSNYNGMTIMSLYRQCNVTEVPTINKITLVIFLQQ